MAIKHFATLLDDVLNGEKSALLLWGSYTFNEQFNEEEINLALQKIKELSSTDTPQKSHALSLRAFMHEMAQGGPQDYPEAIRLYEQAIKLGFARAINNRAFMHQHAQGGPSNYPEAIRLYEQAIKLKSTGAMFNRASMHAKGTAGPLNKFAAIRLYNQAFQLGFSDAKPQIELVLQTEITQINGLVQKLKNITNDVPQDGDTPLAFSSSSLADTLEKQTKDFFNNPSVQQNIICRQQCEAALGEVQKQFEQEPGPMKSLIRMFRVESPEEQVKPIVQEILAVITCLGRMIRLESPAEKEFTIGAARGFFYKVGLVADAGETHLASYLTRLDAAKLVLATKAASDTAKIRYAEHPEANDALYAKPKLGF